MIIQLLLTVGLLVLLVYALIARKGSRLLSLGLYGVVGGGLVFVWAPELSTRLARLLGVGRGADLVIYLWILASMLIALNLHLTCKRMSRDLSTIVQKLAVRDAVDEQRRRLDRSERPPVVAASSVAIPRPGG